MSKLVTNEMIDEWLPIVISDLNTFKTPVTDSSIKASLYHRVIRELYDEQNFLHHEDEYPQVGCYVKGYVRDIWQYLGDAYDLIHERSYEATLNTKESES